MTDDSEILKFLRWAYGDLRSNTVRPMLAEYLVGKALDCLGQYRIEWTAWDFEFEGKKIEVKSAGYVQSWSQAAPSKVIFGIAPAKDAYGINQITRLGPGRKADIYVFCLHAEQDRERAGAHDLSSWQFYVVTTVALEAAVGQQRTPLACPVLVDWQRPAIGTH